MNPHPSLPHLPRPNDPYVPITVRRSLPRPMLTWALAARIYQTERVARVTGPSRTVKLIQRAELTLMTMYLAGELAMEGREALAQFLEWDSDFRDDVAPLIAVWSARAPKRAVSATEVDAAWDRFKVRAGI